MREIPEIEPVKNPQAILDWYNCGSDQLKLNQIEKTRLTSKTKQHLVASGWALWYVDKGNKRELRYESPSGKVYYSLIEACRGYINGAKPDEFEVSTEVLSSCSSPQETSVSSNPSSLNRSCSKFLNRKRERKEGLDHDTNMQNSKKRRRRGKEMTKNPIELRGLNIEKNGDTNNHGIKTRSQSAGEKVLVPSALSSPIHDLNPRTLISWLIDNNVISPLANTVYFHGGTGRRPLAGGLITRDGITCDCCSKLFSITGFGVHAGGDSNGIKPEANIILEDGRSLLDCQIELTRNQNKKINGGLIHKLPNDETCSVCFYGGNLVLCDGCPSSFHMNCIGLDEILLPVGDWFCPHCCCGFCEEHNENESSKEESKFMYCDQCRQKYHVGCIDLEKNHHENDKWFCNKHCQDVFFGLHNLLNKPIHVGTHNLTWTLIKSNQGQRCNHKTKLNQTLDLMHECFEPLKEPTTGRDVIEDVVFDREGSNNRFNCRGFYVVVLEQNDELVSAATVRVHADIAEMPFIATRFQHRRRGLCRSLMNELEKQLAGLGIETLVLPAAAKVEDTWVHGFGFSRMTSLDRVKYRRNNILGFLGTVLCRKSLVEASSSKTESN